MTTDYESFLHVIEDGRIWWLRQDAVRLGAGFLPVCDDNLQLEPRLHAPNQRALVNERTLIGAFGDARLTIPKPTAFERDGFRYVDAAQFLEWLSQYIRLKQSKIKFPNELVNQVRMALAKAAAERPPKAPQTFESLTLALEDWFDKNLDELPVTLRQRIEKEFFPMPWDTLTFEQKQQLAVMSAEDQRKVALAAAKRRRSVALQWDAQNDPSLEDQRKVAWECSIVGWDYWSRVPKLTAVEFCILRHVHDPRNFENNRNSTPGGVGKMLGERVSDDLLIIERSLGHNTQKPTAEWVTWAQQLSWAIPAYLRTYLVEVNVRSTLTGVSQPVTASLIRQHFQVIRDADANDNWWRDKMGDAERYGLLECRVGEGKRGRGGGSLWRPDMIAGWLVDRHTKGKEGLPVDAARSGLKKFPSYEDIAEQMFPQDE